MMAGALPVTLFAPAKLTLDLKVKGVRADGLHLIESTMVAVSLSDVLKLSSGDGLSVVGLTAGVSVDGNNSVSKALSLVGASVAVSLTKNIPTEAGLGGGSSDAAAILRWADVIDPATASKIGSDVVFCLQGGRALVKGAGEVVEPLPHQAERYSLFMSGIACSTATVYKVWDELGGPVGVNGNDLEPAVLEAVPDMARARDMFGNLTGQTPRLAGSGSTWFVEGEFEGPQIVVVDTVEPH